MPASPDREGATVDSDSAPRRVLIVDDAVAYGGSVVSTANLIRGLDRTRYRPYFVTSTSKEHALSKLHEAGAFTQTYAAHKLCSYKELETLGKYVTPVRERSYAMFLVLTALAYAVRLGANLPYMLKLASLILYHRIDLVQLNNGFANEEAALVARLLRRRITVFFRGYGNVSHFGRTLGLDKLARYVAVSRYIKEQAIADGIPADRIVVATPPAIPANINTPRDSIRAQYGIGPDSFVIGSVGRIIPWKGSLEFANAVARVLRRHPDAAVLMVGDAADGERRYFQKVLRRFSELNLTDRVVMTGYVDNVDEHYSAMDVVVHSSIEPEPSGRVIFEAMAHGIPVIASDLGGPKEFIENEVDGFVVSPHDFARVAACIETLRANPEARSSMGKAAKRKVATLYSPAQYAEKVQAAYDDCFAT